MGLYKTASLLGRFKNFMSSENIGEIKSALKNVKETNSALAQENTKLLNTDKKRFRSGIATGLGIGAVGGTAATTGAGIYLHNKSLKKRPMAMVSEETRSPEGKVIQRRKVNISPDALTLMNKQNLVNRQY